MAAAGFRIVKELKVAASPLLSDLELYLNGEVESHTGLPI